MINDLKNQGQGIMQENEEVSFEEVGEWGKKYRGAMMRWTKSKVSSDHSRKWKNSMRQSRRKEEWNGW